MLHISIALESEKVHNKSAIVLFLPSFFYNKMVSQGDY